MRTRSLVLGAALALTGVACSGGGDGSTDCVDLTGEGETFTVRMVGLEFVPSCFTASAAQAITVVNEDASVHSFTLEGTPIDIDVSGGETFNGEPVTGVVAPGTYELVCRYHLPGMRGEVTVVG